MKKSPFTELAKNVDLTEYPRAVSGMNGGKSDFSGRSLVAIPVPIFFRYPYIIHYL